jgi:D-alanyl-D-alanine carboxypeptidase
MAQRPIDQLLERQACSGVPGLSLAWVASTGERACAVAGVSDVRRGVAMTSDAMLGIGSITKTFVAVAALQLEAEGLLDIDAPMATMLGPDLLARRPDASAATARHLMQHTAGLADWESDPSWIRKARGLDWSPRDCWQPQSTLEYRAGAGAPAGRYGYANTHYTILGLCLEAVSGVSLENLLVARIIEPLGLKDTYFETGAQSAKARAVCRYHAATPHFRDTAGVSPAFPNLENDLIDVSATSLAVEWAAAGIVSTAADLLTFGLALRDGRLLRPDQMKAMQDWFVPGAGEAGDAGDLAGVGLGLFRRHVPSVGAVIGHDGDVLGCSASLWWTADRTLAVALLANIGTMHSKARHLAAHAVGLREAIGRALLQDARSA